MITKNENYNFTPYDKDIDEVLTQLYLFDSYSPYQKNLNEIINYINKLENTIYGYTE